jgi:hypothetical protein
VRAVRAQVAEPQGQMQRRQVGDAVAGQVQRLHVVVVILGRERLEQVVVQDPVARRESVSLRPTTALPPSSTHMVYTLG